MQATSKEASLARDFVVAKNATIARLAQVRRRTKSVLLRMTGSHCVHACTTPQEDK